MIAKLIVHAPSRADAAGALADHCREVEVWPIRTNAAFLARCLDHARFLKGDVDTGFIAAEEDALLAPAPLDDAGALAAAAVLAREAATRSNRETGPTPRAAAPALAGFRLNAPAGFPVALHTAGQGRVLRLTRIGDEAFEADLDGGRAAMALWPGPGPHQDWYRPQVRFDDDRDPVPYDYLADEHAVVVYRDGRAYRVDGRTSRGAAAGEGGDGALRAPMPGKIVATPAKPGDIVRKGQPLVVLEAMKMEHALVAPFDGVVETIGAAVGEQVVDGAVLATVNPEGNE